MFSLALHTDSMSNVTFIQRLHLLLILVLPTVVSLEVSSLEQIRFLSCLLFLPFFLRLSKTRQKGEIKDLTPTGFEL